MFWHTYKVKGMVCLIRDLREGSINQQRYHNTRSLGKIKSKENKKLRQDKGIEVMGGFLKGYKCNTGIRIHTYITRAQQQSCFYYKGGERRRQDLCGQCQLFLWLLLDYLVKPCIIFWFGLVYNNDQVFICMCYVSPGKRPHVLVPHNNPKSPKSSCTRVCTGISLEKC